MALTASASNRGMAGRAARKRSWAADRGKCRLGRNGPLRWLAREGRAASSGSVETVNMTSYDAIRAAFGGLQVKHIKGLTVVPPREAAI